MRRRDSKLAVDGHAFDTVLPKLLRGLLLLLTPPTTHEICDDLCSFRSPNRIRLFRLLNITVELRATLRTAIPEKRSGHHDGTYDRRGSCIRLDRIAVGIHDFRGLATVR